MSNLIVKDPLNATTYWLAGSWSGTNHSFEPGRHGLAVKLRSSGGPAYAIPTPYLDPTITVGFAHKHESLAAARTMMQWQQSSTNRIFVQITTAGAIEVRRLAAAGTVIGTTAAGVIVVNTWAYIELQIYSHSAIGTVTLSVNGTPVLTLTNVDTGASSNQIRLNGGTTTIGQWFDDLYIITGPTAFLGDITVPDTAGPSRYRVLVSGMTTSGTVIATIPAAVCTTLAGGLPNLASTSTDNTVTFSTTCVTVLNEPFNNLGVWSATATTIVAGRTGTAAAPTGSTGTANYDIATAGQKDTLTVGFAYRRTDSTTGLRSICGFSSDSGVTTHNRLNWTTVSNVLSFTRSTGTNIATGTFTFVTNTWYYIEVQTKLHDTTGFVTVKIDGTTVINATSLDTKNAGTKTVYDQFRINCLLASATHHFDDLYIAAGAGCSFRGDHTIP